MSALEIAIKYAKDPSAMPYSAEEFLALCEEGGFDVRPLSREAICAYGGLDFEKVGDLHKDPFDRLLLCQAKVDRLQPTTGYWPFMASLQ